jgi:hypothetical protein
MNYCTADEIMSLLQLFQNDWTAIEKDIPESLLDDIVIEATEHIRYLLNEKFTISEIEAMSTLPTAINYATKLKGVFLVLERVGLVSMERNGELKKLMEDSYSQWCMFIQKGLLLDSSGTEISVEHIPRLQKNTNYATLGDYYYDNRNRINA